MIRLAEEAKSDLQSIADHIRADNGEAVADHITARIFASIRTLESFPNLKRVGRVVGTRELGVAGLPFVIIYQSRPDVVAVYRVLHGAMQWPAEDA